ncbi:MAG: MBL fold metallo-hydrolase [Gemmatimonadota bacterium]|nr:MBL fold metallo-hydrolase [Gemmatimonadota bacterium]
MRVRPAQAAAAICTTTLLALALACAAPAPPDPIRTADPYARGYADDDFPRVQELGPGVYSYEQLRSAGEERFTTVSMFVVTDTGVLVADGQGSPEETRRLIDTIATLTDQPITHVVVCSDHGDHTAGNSEFPAGARFYAHPTSQAVLQATADNPIRPATAPPVIVPTELVETGETLHLGGREIRILFLGRAHTGGDLVVHLPAEKILFMSEAYLNRVFPAMRSAYPSEWVAMIEAAQAMDIDTYVPGHGFVDSPEVLAEELETYRRAMVQVIEEATRLHAAGVALEDAVGQAEFGELETWSLRSSQGARAVGRVYMELNGELPPG